MIRGNPDGREFDDAITAPHSVQDAEDYYEHEGEARRRAGERADVDDYGEDDRLCRTRRFEDDVEKCAGAFVAPGGRTLRVYLAVGGTERFWAEERIVEFVERLAGEREERV